MLNTLLIAYWTSSILIALVGFIPVVCYIFDIREMRLKFQIQNRIRKSVNFQPMSIRLWCVSMLFVSVLPFMRWLLIPTVFSMLDKNLINYQRKVRKMYQA